MCCASFSVIYNPLHEDNWMLQIRGKFMKYVIYNGHAWTPKQLNKNPVRPIIKVIPYHKHHIDEGESTKKKLDIYEGESAKDEGESTTSTEFSEDSISDTPTGSSEDSKPIETP